MRASLLPTRPSRSVLTIGIPPATAASKLSATCCFSASAASATPWRASSALLAVITDLPAASAASTAPLAGSPAPPTSSTNTSISGSRASATGSATQRMAPISAARCFPRSRAQTATISMARPQRACSASRWRSIRCTTEAPTVPSPATPTFSGAMERPERSGKNASATGRQGHDVVQLFRRRFKEAADVAGGLADALLVLDQRDADKAFPVLAEADPRRHRHLGLLHQQLREFQAAHRLKHVGQRRPGEHRGGWRRNLPAGAAKAVDEGVAPAAIAVAHVANAILGAVERGSGRHLDRREGTIVEVGFHPRQRRDDALVADRETDAPPGHRKSLRHRRELDGAIHRARDLQHRRRRIVVEIDLRIGEVGE